MEQKQTIVDARDESSIVLQRKREMEYNGVVWMDWAKQHGFSGSFVRGFFHRVAANPEKMIRRGESHRLLIKLGVRPSLRGTKL